MHIGMWAQPQPDQMTGRKEVVGCLGKNVSWGEQKGSFIVLCNHGSVERERERAGHILSGGLHCLSRPVSSRPSLLAMSPSGCCCLCFQEVDTRHDETWKD